MASADPICTNSTVQVGEKLENKLNLFKKVIDEKKSEIIRVREEMKQLIDMKSEQVLKELDRIWEEVNERKDKKRQEIEKNIEEIYEAKKALEKLFLKLDPNSISLPQISERIESAKKEMDIAIPTVELIWGVNELRDCIHRLCRCNKQFILITENTHSQLKWSSCDRGNDNNELSNPGGVAIDPINNTIYVADHDPSRVQVFCKDGEWVKSIKHELMSNPENILIYQNSMFIQCYKCILKLKLANFDKESYISCTDTVGGICTDNSNVYVGVYSCLELLILTFDLKEEKKISLNSQFYTPGKSKIRDISFAQREFYILLSDTEYPIQTFSREGTLIRCLVQTDLLKDVVFFCLDQQLHIIVSDEGTTQVKIFSNEGKLIVQFGEEGTAAGKFINIRGVAVDDVGTVITVDWKDHDTLQAFSRT